MSTTISPACCPFCQSAASVKAVKAPAWHSEDRRPILQFRCEVQCGTMLLDTVGGDIELDPRIQSLLHGASPEELDFLSATNRTWIDGVVYGSWLIEELLYVHKIAAVAVGRFGFKDAKVLSTGGGLDHGNTLLFVNTSKGRFTLRVYAPDTERTEVQSETYWLRSLTRAANIRVPVPVRGVDGSEIQKIDLQSGGRYCAAYEWIEGERLQAVAHSARPSAAIVSIGKNLAAMHNHAESCTLPAWFNRPEYGLAWLRQKAGPKPSEKTRDSLQRIEALGESRKVFGLIHYETGACNILINGHASAFIDFRPFGWGYYFADIVKVIQDLQPEESRIFLEAYGQERELLSEYREMIDCFNEII